MDPSAAAVQLPAETAEFYSIPAANATPAHPPTPSHPPYAEMITAAIGALNEKDGSSKKAIAKYIEHVYPNLPPAHLALLTHHLKRLKNSGHLVMCKKSYMFPPRSDSSADAPPGLGNPNPVLVVLGGSGGGGIDYPFASAADPFQTAPVPRKRGRPPKAKLAQVAALERLPQQQPISSGPAADPGLSNGPKKRPGRPPKLKPGDVPLTVVPIQPEETAAPEVEVVNGSVPTLKRGRGRPRKPQLGVAGGEIVVPALAQVQPVVGQLVDSEVAPLQPRRRGRPKRNPFEFPPLKPKPVGKRRGRPPFLGKVPGAYGLPGVKRRGRPPKNAAALLAPGRMPVGCPKRNGSMIRNLQDGQAELTRKLEFMQACIKSAVSVLKPHVDPNAVDAVTALQRLEELTGMNINTAPEPSAPAPPSAAIPVPTLFDAALSSAVIESEQPTFGHSM